MTMACEKCGGAGEPKSSYVRNFERTYLFDSHERWFGRCFPGICPDSEHLHRVCSGCGYEWIDPCHGQVLGTPFKYPPRVEPHESGISSWIRRVVQGIPAPLRHIGYQPIPVVGKPVHPQGGTGARMPVFPPNIVTISDEPQGSSGGQ